MLLKNEDIEKASQIRDFLEKNYTVNYSYNDLVKKFGINKRKLKVVFKAVVKDNVHEHVIKVRIDHAKHLLENSYKTIKDIAGKVGMDKSNFNIHFKRLTGITPSEWRKHSGD